MLETIYTAHASSLGGRKGSAKTDDKNLLLKFSPPGTPAPGTTNPEQLFACGYAGCFGNAVEYVAQQQGISFSVPVRVDSTVELIKILDQLETPRGEEALGFTLAIALHVTLSGVNRATAERLVAEAHKVCPYSNATRGNISITLKATAVA